MQFEECKTDNSARVIKAPMAPVSSARFLFDLGKSPTVAQVNAWEDDGGKGYHKTSDFEIIEGHRRYSAIEKSVAKIKKFFHSL